MVATQRQSAAKQQKRAREWQKSMMQNAHQWEVQDLIDAGLNPILSAGGSPQSFSAATVGVQGDFADFGNVTGSVQRGTSTAKDAAKTRNELRVLEANVQTARSDAELRGEQAITQKQIRRQESLRADRDMARQPNKLSEAHAIEDLDRSGMTIGAFDTPIGKFPGLKLKGSDLRKWNALIRRYRGTSAND